MAAAASAALAGAVLVCAACGGASTGPSGAKAFRPAPALSGLTDRNGGEVSVPFADASVFVVAFGASWCPPCKAEWPALDALAARRADRGVVFVAIDIDEELSAGVAFADHMAPRHVRVLFDPKKRVVALYDPPTMPTTYVIRDGQIQHVHPGYEPGDEDVVGRAIDRALAQPSPGS